MTETNILSDHMPRSKVAEQLNKTVRTLQRWETLQIGPPVTRIGCEPFYYVPSLREWLRSCETKRA